MFYLYSIKDPRMLYMKLTDNMNTNICKYTVSFEYNNNNKWIYY